MGTKTGICKYPRIFLRTKKTAMDSRWIVSALEKIFQTVFRMLNNAQFFYGYLCSNLAGIFLIKGLAFCDEFPIYNGTNAE